MTFQKTTIIIFSIFFIIILSIFAYLIYKSQKSEYSMISSSCPDYWNLEYDKKLHKYVCKSQNNLNIGSCKKEQKFPIEGLNSLCSKFKAITNKSNCGGSVMWDGVTNNPQSSAC